MLYKTYGRNIYAAVNCIAQLNNTVILSVCNGAGRQIKLSGILVNKDNTGIQLLTSASSVAEGRRVFRHAYAIRQTVFGR